MVTLCPYPSPYTYLPSLLPYLGTYSRVLRCAVRYCTVLYYVRNLQGSRAHAQIRARLDLVRGNPSRGWRFLSIGTLRRSAACRRVSWVPSSKAQLVGYLLGRGLPSTYICH